MAKIKRFYDKQGNKLYTEATTTSVQDVRSGKDLRRILAEKDEIIGQQNQKLVEQDGEIRDFKSTIKNEINNFPRYQYSGNVTNAPDGEDLCEAEENGKKVLKLSDRNDTFGMGYKVLRRGKSFASQVTQANTIYEIRYDFDLGGAGESAENLAVQMPKNCTLKFNGGKLHNGSIVLNKTFIEGSSTCFGDIELSGSVKNNILFVSLFDENTIRSGNAFRNLFKLNISSNIEIFLDKNIEISETLLYKNEINNNCIRLNSNGKRIIYTGNTDAIKVESVDNDLASPTKYNFLYNGYIKNITITCNSVCNSLINISSCWYMDISNTIIECSNKSKYGLLANRAKGHVDYYGNNGLNLKNTQIFRATEAGIAALAVNGSAYWKIYDSRIEGNNNGIECITSSWIINNTSISYNDYGMKLGDDGTYKGVSYTSRNIILDLCECDGNKNALIYSYNASGIYIRNSKLLARDIDGVAHQCNTVVINDNNSKSQEYRLENCLWTADYAMHKNKLCLIYYKSVGSLDLYHNFKVDRITIRTTNNVLRSDFTITNNDYVLKRTFSSFVDTFGRNIEQINNKFVVLLSNSYYVSNPITNNNFVRETHFVIASQRAQWNNNYKNNGVIIPYTGNYNISFECNLKPNIISSSFRVEFRIYRVRGGLASPIFATMRDSLPLEDITIGSKNIPLSLNYNDYFNEGDEIYFAISKILDSDNTEIISYFPMKLCVREI